jgi:hypothetical protein
LLPATNAADVSSGSDFAIAILSQDLADSGLGLARIRSDTPVSGIDVWIQSRHLGSFHSLAPQESPDLISQLPLNELWPAPCIERYELELSS